MYVLRESSFGQDLILARWATLISSVVAVGDNPRTVVQCSLAGGGSADRKPLNGVIFASRQIEGYQAHGAILDPEADYVAAEFWPKDWIEKDPAQEFVMTQSAPLVIPARPNASSFVTVA